MLEYQTHHRGVLREPVATVRYLSGNVAIKSEIDQLAEALDDKVEIANEVYPVAEWPLALHQRYSRREIMAAVGVARPGQKGKIPQGGIFKMEPERRELLFVTLDKSAKSFSPNTRYRDYAVSPRLFHWETQSTASPTSLPLTMENEAVRGGVRVSRRGAAEGKQRGAADGDHVGAGGGDAGEVVREIRDVGAGVGLTRTIRATKGTSWPNRRHGPRSERATQRCLRAG